MQDSDSTSVPMSNLRRTQPKLKVVSKGGSARRHENVRSEHKFSRDDDSSSSDCEDRNKPRRHHRKAREDPPCEPQRDPSCEPKHCHKSPERRKSPVHCRSNSRERRACYERKCEEDRFRKEDKTYGLLTWASGSYVVDVEATPAVPALISTLPILLGDGEYVFESVDGNFQSTNPVQVGGYSKPIPFDGRLKNLEVSMDILVASLGDGSNLNTLGEQYDFTLLVSRSPPNNGTDHVAFPYLTIPLTASLRFGLAAGNANVTAPSFRAASNISLSSYQVYAGDRVGIRVRANPTYDAAAPDVSVLSFQASVAYEKTECALVC